jgi:multicomponent Na+:H+ antiporter subunit C
MTPWLLYAMSGAAVFSIALYGVFSCKDVLRKIIAANLLGSGVFLILVAIARRSPAEVDPVPHTLVLTGIVVSVSATACALALARRLRDGRHDTDPVDLDQIDDRDGPGRELR